MQTVYDKRRENLRSIIRTWGGSSSLAKKLGHSNGSYLAQLAGPHPTRDVSEKVAREIERKLGLALGWMDDDHPGGGRVDDSALTDCVRAVAACLRDSGHRPDPDTYATLVQLVYDNQKLTGRMDEAFVKQLMRLLK